MGVALSRWGEQLRALAIPDEILAAAPESPYRFPTQLFRQRGLQAQRAAATPTTHRATEALPDHGGTVLDVGVGGGGTSISLAGRAARIIGVDGSEEMLDVFRETARAAGVEGETVLGGWPGVANQVEAADVVVCGHVLYNVQDLEPFVRALAEHARRRVVVEITERHPWAWMGDLWKRFHGLARPDGPTADDAVEAIRELGLVPRREDHVAVGHAGFERRGDAVALVRRRLCLAPQRDSDIEQALGDRLSQHEGLWSAGPGSQSLVTLWWDASTSTSTATASF